ncbi:deoxyribose-phosphate aldolase protein [Rutstroemia sp. NJR-2017a BBW]|nr:deoxyribose-phosphate aldolase protein [Rutstroemia sp. NJR-2017a BBW]
MASSINFPPTIKVSLPLLAKMIDHSLLHPTMTDAEIAHGLSIAAKYKVATACVKAYSIPQAVAGNSTTEVKVFEATKAAEAGGKEIDMVVNVGKALSGEWDYVHEEIRQVNDAVTGKGAILKVIFENDFLTEKEIVKLCQICSEIGVAFVKTSTGYGFVKQSNDNVKEGVQIKAAGGVRTLDDLIRVRALGVTRVGATATEAMLEEAMKRGIGEEEVEVKVLPVEEKGRAGGY